MASRDETPRQRPRRKTPNTLLPVTTCPHCRRDDVQVMPSGKMALHTVQGRWKKSMCRGSGELISPRSKRVTKHGR